MDAELHRRYVEDPTKLSKAELIELLNAATAQQRAPSLLNTSSSSYHHTMASSDSPKTPSLTSKPSRRMASKLSEITGSSSDELKQVCFRLAMFRVLPLVVVVFPSYFFLEWLAQPEASFKTVCLLSFGFAVASHMSFPDKIYQPFAGVATLLAGLIGGYVMGLLGGEVFVYVTSIVGVVGCTLMGLLSQFCGDTISLNFGRLYMFVAMVTPPICTFLFYAGFGHSFVRVGFVTSLAASVLNIVFNKESTSIGIPSLYSSGFSTSNGTVPRRLKR